MEARRRDGRPPPIDGRPTPSAYASRMSSAGRQVEARRRPDKQPMSPFPPRARRWATIESVHQPYFLWSKQHAAEQSPEHRVERVGEEREKEDDAVASWIFLCSSAQPRSSENEAWGLSPRLTTAACHRQSAVAWEGHRGVQQQRTANHTFVKAITRPRPSRLWNLLPPGCGLHRALAPGRVSAAGTIHRAP